MREIRGNKEEIRDKSARADKRCETELTGNKAGFRLESQPGGMEMGFIRTGWSRFHPPYNSVCAGELRTLPSQGLTTERGICCR